MPENGDYFEVTLRETHLRWGEYRSSDSRVRIAGEGFIPIPANDARRIGIYNSHNGEGIGYNEFYAKSEDERYCGVIKTSGNSSAGSIYAKNISGSGDLKAFHNWFRDANIHPGTRIRIEWTSTTEVTFKVIER